jgi:bifunctional DNase/RNase
VSAPLQHLAPSFHVTGRPSLHSRPVRVKSSEPEANNTHDGRDFVFDPSDYILATFLPPPYGPIVMIQGLEQGIVSLSQEADPFPTESTEVLEIYIGGDTAFCIAQLAEGFPSLRPMPLDIMQRMVEECFQTLYRKCTVLKVAIVGMNEDVFYGRLFFGDPATGEVLWDCDCRPSDACWLALKFRAPMYVHRAVWQEEARPMQECTGYKVVQQAAAQPSWPMGTGGSMWEGQAPAQFGLPGGLAYAEGSLQSAAFGAPTAADLLTEPEAWEEVRELKRQLDAAVRAEDYSAAIALRDHPVMALSARITAAIAANELAPAAELCSELERLILGARQEGASSTCSFSE